MSTPSPLKTIARYYLNDKWYEYKAKNGVYTNNLDKYNVTSMDVNVTVLWLDWDIKYSQTWANDHLSTTTIFGVTFSTYVV